MLCYGLAGIKCSLCFERAVRYRVPLRHLQYLTPFDWQSFARIQSKALYLTFELIAEQSVALDGT